MTPSDTPPAPPLLRERGLGGEVFPAIKEASDPESKVRHREGMSPGPTPSESYAIVPGAAHEARIDSMIVHRLDVNL